MENNELLIRNAKVADGLGGPAYKADVLVKNGKIYDILKHDEGKSLSGYSKEEACEKASTLKASSGVIDAEGCYLTPGFIDIHRHADAAAFRKDFGKAELAQGLTTIVSGNCGLSIAPIKGEYEDEIKDYLRPITGYIGAEVPTDSMGAYLKAEKRSPLNTMMLVGAGTVRASVAGYKKIALDDEDYSAIHKKLEASLAEGALGISLGMGYAPECFYSTEELIRALEPVRNTDIPVAVHMRQEGSGVVESIKEMLYVAKQLNCPMHISHLKAMGRDNFNNKIPKVLSLLDEAAQQGVRVGCDVYPYTAGSTQFMHILPLDFLKGGIPSVVSKLKDPACRESIRRRIEADSYEDGFDNIAKLVGWDGIRLSSLYTEQNRIYQGMTVTEIARARGVSPIDAAFDLLIEENCKITMIDSITSEDDIIRILKNPLSNLISDATYPTEGMPHPRVYANFTRLLTHFVREKKVLSLEEAVMKMTSAPAKALRLKGKGVIEKGMDADLCIFNLNELRENADFTEPARLSDGMRYVIIDGKVVLKKGD